MSDNDRSARDSGRHGAFWLIVAVLFFVFLWMIGDILLPFAAGAAIAYFLSPMADRLARIGIGRTPAAGLIIVVSVFILLLAIMLIGPIVFDQMRQLSETLPGDLRRLLAVVDEWGRGWLGGRYEGLASSFERGISGMAQSWTGSMKWALQQVWDRGLALVNLLSLLLITPVVAFYLLADWPRVVAAIDDALPRDHAGTIRSLAADINGAVAAFVRGQGTVCLILAVIYAVGLSALGLRYGLVIGLTVGLISFVPFIGAALGLVVVGVIAAAQGWPDLTLLVKVLVLFLAVAVLDTALLGPKIVGPKVGLHPVWLIFSVLAFGSLLGVAGVLIAVPVAAAIAVLVRFAIRTYLGSEIYRGSEPTALPVEPRGDDTTPGTMT